MCNPQEYWNRYSTEQAVMLTQEFLWKIAALKARMPYDHLVTNEFLIR